MTGLLTVVRRWWWVLALSVVAAAGTGYTLAASAAPTYEAQTRLLVGPVNADLNTQRAAGQLAFTYAELVTSHSVVTATLDQLSLGIDAGSFAAAIRAVPNSSTRVLSLTIESGHPERAAAIVNALAANLITTATAESARPEGSLQVIDPAVPALVPVAPLPGLIALVSGIAGLVGSLALVILLEIVDVGIRSPVQLAAATQLPVMAVVRPTRRSLRRLRGDAAMVDPTSEEGLHIELLSAKLEFALGTEATARRIVILPADHGSGSAWLALNAAMALALRGRVVSLIDVDPSGELNHLLEWQKRSGNRRLLRRLRGDETSAELPQNLRVAHRSTDEIEELSDERARQIFNEALADADIALVHAPAIQLAPNTVVWGRAADAVVLVVRAGDTYPLVKELLETLKLLGARPVGTVFVQAPAFKVPSAQTDRTPAGQGRAPAPALRRDGR